MRGTVLAVICTVFSWAFNLPLESKVTLILADAPGEIGVFGYSGTVQPQLPVADEMISGASPTF